MELVRGYAPESEKRASSTCQCGLSTEPPAAVEWWRPDLDADPGLVVRAVVRYGEEPELRRAVRQPNGTGWTEQGAMVDFYHDITPPMTWARIGRCWADTPHPVVAVRQEPTGAWTVGL